MLMCTLFLHQYLSSLQLMQIQIAKKSHLHESNIHLIYAIILEQLRTF